MLWGILKKTKDTQNDRNRVKLVEKAFEEETKESVEIVPPDFVRELEIIDQRYTLPRNKTHKWGKRDLSKISLIVLHHSATPRDKSSFRAIANYAITPSENNHLSKDGAPAIPYHYGIDEQVGVSWLNDLEDITWGAKGYNTRSIHICCLGDFSTAGSHEGADEVPTSYTTFYLPELIRTLKKRFPSAQVVTHKQLGKYNCPGDTIVAFSKTMR